MPSLNGYVRKLRLRLTGKELILTGQCRQCGNCCRHLHLSHKGHWLRSRLLFGHLKRRDKQLERFVVTGRDRDGLLVFACRCLGSDGRCRDYANRPQLCRDFPNKEIFFSNAELPDGCGYHLSEGIPFQRLLEREKEQRTGGKTS